MKLRKLTPEEARVIRDKGTEARFAGRYHHHFEAGLYLCRWCGTALFRSEDKFDSGSGWPSFDDAVAGALRQEPDEDGLRTEILCARCGAHLGHVFVGEGLTDKNLRHCVNSISLDFLPADRVGRAIFAGGCFWGVEHFLAQEEGVVSTTVGYTGGTTEDPTYEEVCSGRTGHAEAVEVLYDKAETTFERLARLFFEIHDPTQEDGQGPDIGDQYRSAIFYLDDEQKDVAERLIGLLRAKGLEVVTSLEQAGPFWPAEENHQDYYRKRGTLPYCHVRLPKL